VFRNKEFLRAVILYSILAVLLIVVGFIYNLITGILVSVSAVLFTVVFFIFTQARYRNISRISKQIDLVLHNEDRLDLDSFDEGELSILHNDITKMTLRIREQNDSLVKDKKYLADLLADIAHQLRTPLTSANLILSFLAKNENSEQRQKFVRELEELLVRMDWLITSLLKLSRLDAGVVSFQSELFSVNNMIESAYRPFLIPMELRNITVQTDIPDDIQIQGDISWLSEAVQNIIKNCMESIGENGTIEIICADNNLYTELTIHDSGRGFEDEDILYLFDRFYRGKSDNATGYGIGLSLSRMIISRQGGTITAKNHPHGGAVFVIRFVK